MSTKHLVCAAATSLVLLSSATAGVDRREVEEVYITGLGHVFSLGVCAIGSGSCISYLFVESKIEELCRRKARVVVAGHSMGASAAIKLAREVSACGGKVEAAAFLDPLVHPRSFGLPAGVRTLTFYSPAFAGIGEGEADAERAGAGHILQSFDPVIHAKVRSLFDNAKASR